MARSKKELIPVSEMLSMNGRTCLITGAAAGIGAAIATRFAEAGADLILVDLDERRLRQRKRALESKRCSVEIVCLDLADSAAIDDFWRSRGKAPVDTLVNNAGLYPFQSFLEFETADLERIMQVNLHAVVWMCRHFIRHNRRKGGVIINMGSIEAMLPFKKDLALYSMAKAAVHALTRDLAKEFGPRKFRVNAILPGGIKTEGTRAAAARVLREADFGVMKEAYDFKQRMPAGRMGKPDEVARVALFLASDMAAYMHGALVPVDGGFLSA